MNEHLNNVSAPNSLIIDRGENSKQVGPFATSRDFPWLSLSLRAKALELTVTKRLCVWAPSPDWTQLVLLTPLWFCPSHTHLRVPWATGTLPLCPFVPSAFFLEGSPPRCLHGPLLHPCRALLKCGLCEPAPPPPVELWPEPPSNSLSALFLPCFIFPYSTLCHSMCILLIYFISLTVSSHKSINFTGTWIIYFA